MLWSTLLKKALVAAIPAIPELLRSGVDWLKHLGTAPAMTAKSTTADIEQINDSICELREAISSASRAIVNEAADYILAFAEDQLFGLEDKSELLERYQISTNAVKERLHNVQDGLEEFWEDALYRKISLDNSRCRAVLALPAGEKKEVETKKLTETILDETIGEYVEFIQARMENLYEGLEEDIQKSIERLEETVEKYSELTASMDNEDEENCERILEMAYDKAAFYAGILDRAVI